MRIRRRFPPSSSTDPQLNRSSLVVQLQPQGNPQPSDPPPNQPSDQKMMIPDEKGQWVSPRNSTKSKGFDGEQIKDDSWVVEETNSNDFRKECTLNAEVDIALLPSSSSSSSSDQDGRWGEGDKVIPLKKRKRSFDNIKKTEDDAKWKSKTNKKCLQQKDNDKLKEKSTLEDVHDDAGNSTKNKKKRRSNVIMEGSRCSRVNGRGWRCCQQTLVGYSLCEHHLGKGRLRSISSVPNRAGEAIAPKEEDYVESQASLSSGEIQENNKSLMMDDNEDSDDDDENPTRVVTNKKKTKRKIGMVKARSMSSLLVQMDNAVARSRY